MAAASVTEDAQQHGAFAPLREPTFRTIWTASLFSNFGQLILGVGAAWEMTRLTPSASMVALVQSAMMLPLMLVAVPAGAIADMFDRRRIAMVGLGFAMLSAAMLATLAFLGLTTPWILLGFCVLIGGGVALYGPAWQASIPEQVKPGQLPAAVALGSVSYNVARSFGPALGGLIVLAAGAQAAFGVNAICYIPLFMAFFFWKRHHVPSRLPPERIDRAIVSGARYALHSHPIRTVMGRAFLFGLAGASSSALAPLVARDLLQGDASTFGLLLGASGVGAVAGALSISAATERFGTETAIRICAAVTGIALCVAGASTNIVLTSAAFFVAGGANILTIALLNITVQLSAPRWVTARALSLFQSALTGGIAIGAWMWGEAAGGWTVEMAMIGSGVAVFLTILAGVLVPLPETSHAGVELVEIGSEPNVALGITMRSGPVAIEIDYHVDPERARDFYNAIRTIQRIRLRNGGFGWSISRDIANPAIWTERYSCPTWGDYLRMRSRLTQADRDQQALVDSFHSSPEVNRVRRRLERPFGSVRWRAESPDPHQDNIGIIGP